MWRYVAKVRNEDHGVYLICEAKGPDDAIDAAMKEATNRYGVECTTVCYVAPLTKDEMLFYDTFGATAGVTRVFYRLGANDDDLAEDRERLAAATRAIVPTMIWGP